MRMRLELESMSAEFMRGNGVAGAGEVPISKHLGGFGGGEEERR